MHWKPPALPLYETEDTSAEKQLWGFVLESQHAHRGRELRKEHVHRLSGQSLPKNRKPKQPAGLPRTDHGGFISECQSWEAKLSQGRGWLVQKVPQVPWRWEKYP